MNTYTTAQGDMWDLIAFTQLGDVSYTDSLMNMNQQHISYYIFPAGITLILPDVEPGASDMLPPWKLVEG